MSNVIQIVSAAGVLETLTGDIGGGVAPTGGNINLLGINGTVVTGDPLTSTLYIDGGGGGGGTITAVDSGDNITVNTVGTVATVNLNKSILQPPTNGSGTEGIYALGVTDVVTDRFMHNYGTGNTFLGEQSGNLTLTSGNIVAIGYFAATELTSGSNSVYIGAGVAQEVQDCDDCVIIGAGSATTMVTASSLNTIVGSASFVEAVTAGKNSGLGAGVLSNLVTGDQNCGFGYFSGYNLQNSSYNCLIGSFSGYNLVSNESNNVLISSQGQAGDQNCIRIGSQGSGARQQNTAYMAGIYANTVDGGTQQTVVIDSTGKLGSVSGGGGSITAVDSGDNITVNTVGTVATVNLNESILQPDTSTDGSEGVYALGSISPANDYFMHNYGTENTFLGKKAGNLTNTSSYCVALGFSAGFELTSSTDSIFIGHNSGSIAEDCNNCIMIGSISGASMITGCNSNIGIGTSVLELLDNGSFNCAYGENSGANLVSGSNNLLLGTLSGNNLVSNESDNVLVASEGQAGDQHIIRIGMQGVGAGQQNTAYMAGIYGSSVGGTNALVIVDNTGKLGSTSSGGFASTFDADSGSATPSSGVININGDTLITTSASGNTVDVNLSNGTNGQVLIGGGAAPVWANITSTDGSVTVTDGANTIDLSVGGSIPSVPGCRFWTGMANGGANVPIFYECTSSTLTSTAVPLVLTVGPAFPATYLVNFSAFVSGVKISGGGKRSTSWSGVSSNAFFASTNTSIVNYSGLAGQISIGGNTSYISATVPGDGTQWLYNFTATFSITTI